MDRDKALREVVCLAGQLVLETPRPSKRYPAPRAYIRRDLIEKLEAALVASGVNMAEARRLYSQKILRNV